MKSLLTGRILFLLLMAGLGGLLYGVDFGVIAAAEPYLRTLALYSTSQVSLIVGAVLLGGLLASLSAGFLCDFFGRKKMILASSGLFLFAIPLVCLSLKIFPLLYVGRILQGMSAGYMSVVMPMYLTETLPPAIRGRGTGVFQFFLGLGLVTAALAGVVVVHLFGSASSGLTASQLITAWRMNFWWTLLPVSVLFIGSFFLKESPVFLARRHAPSAPNAPIPTVRPHDSLLQRRYVVPFLIALAVLILNKTTGMSSFTSYLVTILTKAGWSGVFANMGQVVVMSTNLIVTVIAASLIDRIGRTQLLKIGTAGMTLGLFAIGCVFFAIERMGVTPNSFTGALTVGAFILMQIFYALGPGICVWLVLSELLPQRIRATGMGLALFGNQLAAFLLASSFHPWVETWGWFSMFFFFAANGLVYFLIARIIPETKGKSLTELETLFASDSENCNIK